MTLRATLENLAAIEIRDAIASGGLVLRLTLEARAVLGGAARR